MRVLYVEDATFLAEAVKHNLEKQGILVDLVNNGEVGLENAMSDIYDCVVLDIMLPKLSGTDILKRMREKNVQTPVIMLSALSEVETKINHLDHGADDYLAKPFNTEELLARIRALLRRKPSYKKEDILTFGDLSLDVNTATLSSGDKKVSLMNKELQIMILLMNKQGSIVSLDAISRSAWDIDSYSTSENVWVFVSYLRKKISQVSSKVKIKSIRYQGYYLEQEK